MSVQNSNSVKSVLAEIQNHFEELNDLARATQRTENVLSTGPNPNNGQGDDEGEDDDGGEDGNKDENFLRKKKKKVEQLSNINKNVQPVMLLHETSIRRNKRCLLAYHQYRLDKLKHLRWETCATLPPYMKSLLSEAEEEFYKEYDTLVSRYNEKISLSSGGILDLNANVQPPEEDLVEVRVVKSGLGTIVTESWGEVSLDLGTIHFLPRNDVEHFIRQGYLQQLDAEETF